MLVFISSGAKTYQMDLTVPIASEEEIIEKYDKFFEEHKDVKIAVIGIVFTKYLQLYRMTNPTADRDKSQQAHDVVMTL